jgi:hypothetical protein
MVTAAMQGTEVETAIAGEELVRSGHQVETQLARAIDLATPEIAVVEIGLAVATFQVVLRIGAPSEIVADTAATVRVQAAVEVLPAWAVRVAGALAERAVEVAAAAAVVEVVAEVGGSEVKASHQQLELLNKTILVCRRSLERI